MNSKLFKYIEASPTAFHACAHSAAILTKKGFQPLEESEEWALEYGKGYFVTRNSSSLIAFKLPENKFDGFMISAAHSDSPCFKIKENAALSDGRYQRLSVEKYGGMICSSWLDRPLSVAGRVIVKNGDKIETRLVDFAEPVATIPSVAIHMNRNVNDGVALNAAVDMLPLFSIGEEEDLFGKRVADLAGADREDILSFDLYLYNAEKGVDFGEFLSAPRLDDLQCAFASLEAFADSATLKNAAVYCLFDNEEVGSATKQGADSTFLYDVLSRINHALSGDEAELRRKIASSFMASLDNAHAIHPNHPEYSDKNHAPSINGGIVIKHNANQKYTTDAVSAALFKMICEEAGVPCQSYTNRADMPGGSTLGNIANSHVSLNTVDIGISQLAMHSAYETAGSKDTEYLIKALQLFYGKAIKTEADGVYRII